jgi:3-oxoacyl-[acyl-carrier protein] reductase
VSDRRRIAVIGGAGGIGRALVQRLADAGHMIANLDLPQSLARFPSPGGVVEIAVHATKEAEIRDAFARLDAEWGGLDGLVHLAGYSDAPKSLVETDGAAWDAVTEVNLRSAYLAARHGFTLLAKGQAPSLVFTSSGLSIGVEKGLAAYSCAKAGLNALTKVLAKEWAPTIRVNAVAPGPVETDFFLGGLGHNAEPGARNWLTDKLGRDAIGATIPLGRIGAPEDVSGPVMFLLGADSAYVTGQIIFVNGGRLMPV